MKRLIVTIVTILAALSFIGLFSGPVSDEYFNSWALWELACLIIFGSSAKLIGLFINKGWVK